MRKIVCHEVPGVTATEVIEEFNERREEFGITDDSQIISISTRALNAGESYNIHSGRGSGTDKARVMVTVFSWSK